MAKAKRWGVLVLVAFAFWFAWGWYMRGTRHFCNGYRLQWMNGSEAVILDSANNVVTSGTVTRYATNCPFITGYTRKQGFPPETNPVEGYFVIDTDNKSQTLGMSEADWKEKLAAIHWQMPHMHQTHAMPFPSDTPNHSSR